MFGLGKQQKAAQAEQSAEALPQEQPAPVTQPGGQRLNLVGRDQFARAVAAAVRHGIETHFRGAPPEHIEAAISTAKSSMVSLLRKDSKAVRGLPKAAFLKEVQESKAKIEAEREAARRELEKMLGQLGSRREEVGQMKANLVEEARITGMEQDYELSQRISKLFDASGNSPELAAIREQVTALMMQQMHAERDKVIEAQLAEHRREVTKFERRITKLTSSLELTEEELKKIAAAKGIDLGVASIYRNVQGLSGADADYETKKELMSSIFAANMALQKGQTVAT